MRDPDSSENTLPEFLGWLIPEWLRANLNTALPGRVETVNSDGTVNVQPAIDMVTDAGTLPRPTLLNVPVAWLAGGGSRITAELAVGDSVLLVVCQRSIDVWKSTKHRGAPSDKRLFAMRDAIAIPLFTDGGTGTLRIESGGDLRIEVVGNVTVTADGSASVTATSDISLTAGGDITAAAGGTVSGFYNP